MGLVATDSYSRHPSRVLLTAIWPVLSHRVTEATPVTLEQWWSVYNLFTILAIAIGSVVAGLLVALAVKYRYKPGQPEPEDSIKPGVVPKERGNKTPVLAITAMVLATLAVVEGSTFGAYETLLESPHSTIVIKVTGFQWNWRFEYPKGVQTVGEVVVPVGRPVVFKVTSSDVKHKFGIPELKIGVDAIPNEVSTIWVVVGEPGEYYVRCYELCGVGHALMVAKMVAMEPGEFESWLASKAGWG
jgi:cytochrome c oxidase subunit 2